MIAFLTSITEKVGKEARYLHKGMTSSDVLDTCFNLQLKQSGEILLNDIDQVLNYANSLSSLDIENADLDKMEEEIESFSVNLKKKYKEYLPKKDLDSGK